MSVLEPNPADSRMSMRESVVEREGGKGEGEGGVEAEARPVAEIKPDAEEDDDDQEIEIGENSPASMFLYSPFQLQTSKRKRIQRLLLHMQLREIRSAFNKQLAQARSNKVSLISRVSEMKTRILDLHKMLSQPGVYPWPDLNEVVDSMPNIFTVADDEVLVEKHLNKAERQRALQLAHFEEQQARLLAGNDACERALMDMMGGILEKKLEVVGAEEQIKLPAWMEGNPKKFTKEQHLEIKAFDAMLKAIADEKDKKIRAQEAEQKALRAEVDNICFNFDAQMEDLFQQRLSVEAQCIAIEETIARLSASIEKDEFVDERTEANMNKNMERLKTFKAQSVASLAEFKKEVESFEAKYQAATKEDLLQDKNFRKDFADTGDAINILHKKFKDRPKAKGSGVSTAARSAKKAMTKQTTSTSSRSPSRNPSRRQSNAQVLKAPPQPPPLEAPADPFNDRPPEITVPQWERLLATRKRKMQQEAEVARLTSIMKSMAGFLVHLTQVDDSNSKEIEVCLRTMADFREEREIGRKNLEFIIKMKSGFVEAILDPLQGDYADVVLLPCSLIEDFNKVVLYEANTKMEMLKQTIIFKAKNHVVEWEISKNCLRQQHIIEKIRALQLLRVTKATQQVIRTGEDPVAASEGLALEKRFEHNKKMHSHRVRERDSALTLVQGKKGEMQGQNAKMLVKTKALHVEEHFLARLCSSRLAAEQKLHALDQRFQALYLKRQLHNRACAQAKKLEELGEEFVKMQNRIIPRLPNANMSNYNYPSRSPHFQQGRAVLEARKAYFLSLGSRPSMTHDT
nr:cilia- and flagella-associated protein 43-like isoform X1 [Physcomitrium patens]|eukprot:XP_024380049.1 cilia- and flagella-associated protein 43-like isoform X1 [Physcomitrella patens]